MSSTAIVFIALAVVAFIIIVASLGRRGTGRRDKSANDREGNVAVYIIEKVPGQEYHMISGEHLEYNLEKARSMGEKYVKRVEEVMARFDEKRKEPCTFYLAVEVDQRDFRNGNTNIPR